MPSPLSLRDEAIRLANAEIRARHEAALGRPLTNAQVVGWQQAGRVGVDAVLGVLTTRIQQLRVEWGLGTDPASGDYGDPLVQQFGDCVLAALGVAATTPESREDMPYEAWVASQGGDPGPGPGAASLPTHDQPGSTS